MSAASAAATSLRDEGGRPQARLGAVLLEVVQGDEADLWEVCFQADDTENRFMTRLADRAWELLADGLSPQEIVQRLAPRSRDDALHLARRLPLLDERPASDRGAAMARLAARVGMRRHGLAFTPTGSVGDDLTHCGHDTPPPTMTFPGDGCAVAYTAGYFRDRDHFSFVGHGEPPRPHPLSGTGYWSHFAAPDAVAALGGPEAYVAAYAASGPDRDRLFREAFEGERQEVARKPRKAVVGKHTERVVEPPVARAVTEPDEPPERDETPPCGQRSLFS